ncbi:MAG: hypothetical protein ACJ8F3_19210 [Xanthobacteraceae bacterium]
MSQKRAVLCTALLVVALGGLPASLPGTPTSQARAAGDGWAEVKWPFPLDQWGTGRAFECNRDACGAKVQLYVRPKLGFCNCATGVSDDAELDRVSDLELFSETFEGLADGRPIKVGTMNGRSRAYEAAVPYEGKRTVLAIAFNDRCDVVVATAVADPPQLGLTEQAALDLLNGSKVLRWIERELGL